jgi:long-chain acyl-CoA synthetase
MAKQKKQYLWQPHYPKGTSWKARVTPQAVGKLFDKSAKLFANKVAIDFFGTEISYRQLKKSVDSFAASLQASGVAKGDRVGIMMPNCPQFVIAYYAILKIGAVAVNYNPLYTLPELEDQVTDSETSVMVTLDLRMLFNKAQALQSKTELQTVIVANFAHYLPKWKRRIFSVLKFLSVVHRVTRFKRCVSMEAMIAQNKRLKPVEIDVKKDMAVLQYTGGTTGIPKGAMLSHANVSANMQQIGLWFKGFEEGGEVMLCVLPLFHVFAMTAMMNLGMLKGCKLILHPRVKLKDIVRDMQQKNVSVFMGVPTLFGALAHCPKITTEHFASLKACISGGAPLAEKVKEEFEALAKTRVVEGYGLTEASPVVAVNPIFGKEKSGSVGLPLPQTIVEVRRNKAPFNSVKPGKIGEICVQGPQVMMGYWRQEKETQKVIKKGVLRTGDIGYIDEEGYVHIVDRLKETILVSGFNVYPRQVEEVLYKHPDIAEAAVIGAPHPRTGQQVKAYVRLKPGRKLEVKELRAYLAKNLTKYKRPKVIEFVSSLPKTMIGKIEKKKLR